MPSAELPDVSLAAKEKKRAAANSVLAALALTGMKLVVGLFTGSLGILAEAAHSGLDLVAAFITYLAVRVSDRPADENHPYGHGKIENFSALVETFLLLVTCAWIIYEAVNRIFFRHVEITPNVWAFLVVIVSIIVDISRSRMLYRAARKHQSQALEADALHFKTDIWSSGVVFVGLICAWLGFHAGDSIAASMVAFIVLTVSYRLGKRTIDVLLDRVPAGVEESVRSAVAAVPGVEEVRSLRLRQSGAYSFLDAVIGIRRTRTFDEAHSIMTAVEEAVNRALPRCDVVVHAEPVLGADERMSESLVWIVNQFKLVPHNITILRIDGRHHVDLDIEYPTGTPFAAAHDLAARIEERIRREIDDIAEVSVHLEEEMAWNGESVDVTREEEALTRRITESVGANPRVAAEGVVTIYRGQRGLKVNITCSLDREMKLTDVHDVVNAIETAVSQLDPRITKVFVHAEPAP